ncbi:MAG: VOC family protein [Patescibacteria group bacterium]
MKFHHVGLKVFDLSSMLGFYRNLGFRLIEQFTKEDGEQSFAILEGLGVRLELISGREQEEPAGWDHLSFKVKNLMKDYNEFKERGLQFLSVPKKGTSCHLFVFFVDPEENKLELYEE